MTSHLSDLTLIGGTTIIGYHAGQIAKRFRLPSLIGYMFLGVVLGPSLFRLFEGALMHRVSFITEIALGLVAFSIGSELNIGSLKRLGSGIISIIFAESLIAFFVVLGAVYLLTKNLPLALIFGAVAPASAPAGTVAVIQECRAKGNLTKALYAVVGFDDGLAILIFGFSAAVAKSLLVKEATGASESIVTSLAQPCVEIIYSIVVGAILGFLFCQLIRNLAKSSDMLIMVIGVVLLASGISIQWHLSLILVNMMVGFVLVNTRREELVSKATSSLLQIMPFVFILFFCLAGAHLDVRTLPELGMLGVVYIIARSVGLIGGARIGASLGHVDENVKKYVGLGILSQAGVAIGLSLIIQHEFKLLADKYPEEFAQLALRMPLMHPVAIGATVITTITATCIFFEIIGPILTKVALEKAGEIPKDD